MTATDRPYAYVAGPLFDEGERWFIEKIDQLVQDAGFDTFCHTAITHPRPPKMSVRYFSMIKVALIVAR